MDFNLSLRKSIIPGASTLLGLLNVSFAALIMLMTFLMMDEEAIKYLKRKTKYFWKKETFGEFEKRQIPTKPRKKKDASDVYVIDLEI